MGPAGYILRHWRGELPLPIAYWINGVLLSMTVTLLHRQGVRLAEDAPIRLGSVLGALMLLAFLAITAWSIVGGMRSSRHHVARGGLLGWAIAAQLMLAFTAANLLRTMHINALPQLKEFGLIALGADPLMEIEVEVATDGKAMVLRGTFGTGSAETVRRQLAAAPHVKTLMLESSGGRLKEAGTVADLVRARALNTYVESHCESACTYVFLAGVDRAATPNARVGFHSPTFPGLNEDAQQRLTEQMLAVYRAAGISKPFLEHVAATSPASMWYPTRDELIENGVLNRVSLGGEVASLGAVIFRSKKELALAYRSVPALLAVDKRFPGTIDAAVDAAWQARLQGSSDADVNSAARDVLSASYPRLLAAANEESLDEFLGVLLDQLKAARSVSHAACGLLLNAKLDVSKTLPADLISREFAWINKVLALEPIETAPVDDRQFESVIELARQRVAPEMLAVMANFDGYEGDDQRQCDAAIDFYGAVQSLPKAKRYIALRGLFQSPAQTVAAD